MFFRARFPSVGLTRIACPEEDDDCGGRCRRRRKREDQAWSRVCQNDNIMPWRGEGDRVIGLNLRIPLISLRINSLVALIR